MEQQEIFSAAATHVLPSAITAECNAYGQSRHRLGQVVHLAAKPTVVAWRKQSMQFAQNEKGNPVSLGQIMVPESAQLMEKIRTQSTLFTRGGGREVKVEFTRQASLCGSVREVAVRADFGAVYQVTSNLLGLLDSFAYKMHVDLTHPFVSSIVKKGGQFYVISTVYEAEKAEISVSENSGVKETSEWKEAFSSKGKMTLAVLLLRLQISTTGLLRPIIYGSIVPQSLSVDESDGERGDLEEVDAAHSHGQCGSRELQVFQSDTYTKVVDEATELVKALRNNRELQNEFLSVVGIPGSDLEKLSTELQSVQESMGYQSEPVGLNSFPGLSSKLSTPPPLRQEELKALTIATEAFRELTLLATKRLLTLSAEERKRVFELFSHVPMSSSSHTLPSHPFDDSDTLFFHLLKRIGFGETGGHLHFSASDSPADMIAVTITAIQATTKEG